MSDNQVELIKSRLASVYEKIDIAAKKAGRNRDDVKLVVVTKAQSLEITQAAIDAGAVLLGENYPQEAVKKIQSLYQYKNIEWHMIGHLQSRKAKIVASHFNMIHSIDSFATAQNLDKALSNEGRNIPALLEINIGGELSKSGWQVTKASDLSNILADIEGILNLQHLDIRGVMTMPPWNENPEKSRPYFKLLAEIQKELSMRFPEQNWRELSMGTSIDFMVAVEEGATFVRIGQAIVGSRPA